MDSNVPYHLPIARMLVAIMLSKCLEQMTRIVHYIIGLSVSGFHTMRYTMVAIFIMAAIIESARASATADGFLKSCEKYFYRDTAPSGFPPTSNLKYVCQRYNSSFHFATLYDTNNRIPLYSAYKIDELTCEGRQPSRRDEWFIEPELAGRDRAAEMVSDIKVNRPWVMPVQAINEDYKDTGFDRGHLNPNFMHCGRSRVATFTLTNSVPQDPCFNRITWYGIESDLKDRFQEKCSFQGANRHVIAGAVPSNTTFIPPKDILVDDQPDKETERVNVPSHMWVLSCCDAKESNGAGKSYFHGIIAGNRAEGKLEEFTDVSLMEKRLGELYGFGSQIKLLIDGCDDRPNEDSLNVVG